MYGISKTHSNPPFLLQMMSKDVGLPIDEMFTGIRAPKKGKKQKVKISQNRAHLFDFQHQQSSNLEFETIYGLSI